MIFLGETKTNLNISLTLGFVVDISIAFYSYLLLYHVVSIWLICGVHKATHITCAGFFVPHVNQDDEPVTEEAKLEPDEGTVDEDDVGPWGAHGSHGEDFAMAKLTGRIDRIFCSHGNFPQKRRNIWGFFWIEAWRSEEATTEIMSGVQPGCEFFREIMQMKHQGKRLDWISQNKRLKLQKSRCFFWYR